jgi:protein-disulfide isomerase
VLGLPIPLLGVWGFAALLGVSLFADRPVGRFLRPLALLGGGIALLLVLAQALLIRHFCALCLVVDGAALVIAAVEGLGGRGAPAPALGPVGRGLWLAAAAVAVVAPLSRGLTQVAPPVSEEIKAHWVPGKVNVVEVTDFECPHCRRMHPVVSEFLREAGDRVHFVRLTVPLLQHQHALDASRAYVCAQKQGKADAMADALFAAGDLTPAACERLAQSLHLSLPEFRQCVADPDTDRGLDANNKWLKTASPKGLPVLWIQDQMLFGQQALEALRAALEEAEKNLAKDGSGTSASR